MAHVKARLLTETIYDIDSTKKALRAHLLTVEEQRAELARREAELEEKRGELRQVEKNLSLTVDDDPEHEADFDSDGDEPPGDGLHAFGQHRIVQQLVLGVGIVALLANPDRAAALGARLRQRAVDHYDWMRAGEMLLTIYDQLAREAGLCGEGDGRA